MHIGIYSCCISRSFELYFFSVCLHSSYGVISKVGESLSASVSLQWLLLWELHVQKFAKCITVKSIACSHVKLYFVVLYLRSQTTLFSALYMYTLYLKMCSYISFKHLHRHVYTLLCVTFEAFCPPFQFSWPTYMYMYMLLDFFYHLYYSCDIGHLQYNTEHVHGVQLCYTPVFYIV